MISVIMSGLEDVSEISQTPALYTELVRPQGSNSRRKESHDYVDPDTVRRIRNMEDMKNSRNIEDKRNMLDIEDIRSLEESWSTRNIEKMKNIEDTKTNMERNTRDIEKLEDSRLRLDTGDSQRTEYFFMQGSGLGSPLRSGMPQPSRPRTRSIMDKIE